VRRILFRKRNQNRRKSLEETDEGKRGGEKRERELSPALEHSAPHVEEPKFDH